MASWFGSPSSPVSRLSQSSRSSSNDTQPVRLNGDFFFEVRIHINEIVSGHGNNEEQLILIISPARKEYGYARTLNQTEVILQTTPFSLLENVERDAISEHRLTVTRRGRSFPTILNDEVHCMLPTKIDRDNLYDFLYGMAQYEGLSFVRPVVGVGNWAVTHYHYPLPSITLVGGGSKSGRWVWKYRWFVLTAGRLMVFRNPLTSIRDGTGYVPMWSIHLSSCTCTSIGETDMLLTTLSRKFNFRFPSRVDRDNWLTAINNGITIGGVTKASSTLNDEKKTTSSINNIEQKLDGMVMQVMDPLSDEFYALDKEFKAALNNQIDCYVKEVVARGHRPTGFRLVSATKISNRKLDAQFSAGKARIAQLPGRGASQMRIEKAFHGTHSRNIVPIATNGLLRVGHPSNPSTRIDDGYFGCTDKGIYVSRYVDYCLKYANGLSPLLPTEKEVQVIMFDVIPGHSCHIPEMKIGMSPTDGYDSHSSASHMEWYLFHEDQCVPRYVLTIKAFENRRTAEDDEKMDVSITPPTPTPTTTTMRSANTTTIAAPNNFRARPAVVPST